MARDIAPSRTPATGRTIASGRSVASGRRLVGVTYVPSAPVLNSAVAGDGQVTLEWQFPVDATSCKVYRATVMGGPYSLVDTVSTYLYTDTGRTNGVTYYYVVTGVNSAGESANSNELSATPAAASSGNALVSGAGTAEANALYTPRGVLNGRTYYNLVGQPDDPDNGSIVWNGGTAWFLLDLSNVILYDATEDVAEPWDASMWRAQDGAPPPPTVTEA